jgi:hypothetical protein
MKLKASILKLYASTRGNSDFIAYQNFLKEKTILQGKSYKKSSMSATRYYVRESISLNCYKQQDF